MYYYIIGLISIVITVSAQILVNSRYKKYSVISNRKRMSGFEVAKVILEKNGLSDIYVVETKGILSDHYDPKNRVVRLSKEVFHDDSISALAIAAHECGHAVQHKNGNVFMKFRSFLVPFVNFGSSFGYIIIVIGFVVGALQLVYFGIALLGLILLFQIVTLPVEFGASKDALSYLYEYKLIDENEKGDVREVLGSAALTYVASLAVTVLEIARLIFLANRD